MNSKQIKSVTDAQLTTAIEKSVAESHKEDDSHMNRLAELVAGSAEFKRYIIRPAMAAGVLSTRELAEVAFTAGLEAGLRLNGGQNT